VVTIALILLSIAGCLPLIFNHKILSIGIAISIPPTITVRFSSCIVQIFWLGRLVGAGGDPAWTRARCLELVLFMQLQGIL